MGLGDKAKEVAIEHVKQKAARDILNGIKEWRNNRILTAKRRWVFELIQNAIDTAKARQRDSLKIEININDKSIIFKHNGGYFTLDEISAVIYGGSTKPYAPESEYIGRFGAGFLVTHIISRKVRIRGYLKENGEQIYRFELDITRESNTENEISQGIENCFFQLNNATPLQTDSPEYYTEFIYYLNDSLGTEAINEGIAELKRNLPFVFAFNNIWDIIINRKRFIKEINRNRNIICVKVGKDTVNIKQDEESGLQVGVLVEDKKISSLEKRPKIFIGMPLTESADYMNIPFVVNSIKFDSSKERDALSSDSEENKKLLHYSCRLYYELLNEIIKTGNIGELFNLVNFQLIPDDKVSQNPLWEDFNGHIKETFKRIIEKVPLVNTLEGTAKEIKNIIFPMDRLNSKQMGEGTFNKFYNTISKIKKNIPIRDLLSSWMNIAEKLIEVFPDDISLYTIEDMKNELVAFVKKADHFRKFENFNKEYGLSDPKQFLLSFFELGNDLYKSKIIDSKFMDYLLPGQTGIVGPLRWDGGQLHRDNNVPEDFKDIVHKIGWEIRQELLDRNFADFEIVKELVYEATDVEKALEYVINTENVQPDEEKIKKETQWEDNIIGWIELFRWCVKSKKLRKDIPIIIKDNKTHRIENLDSESFTIPFKYMNVKEEFEDIYPESRIIHQKYFEIDNLEEFIKALREYRTFVTSLPLYKSNVTLGYNKLSYILLEDSVISKVDHKVESSEDTISVLPFWSDIIGKISEYQERGKLLFKFVLEYLINSDESWERDLQVSCSCKDKNHKIIPSQWLANLKTDAWVPFRTIENEEEKIVKREATKESIENLFTSNELEELITTSPDRVTNIFSHFGFDELDLRIKLYSIEAGISEKQVRKDVSKLLDIPEIALEITNLAKEDPDGLKQAIKTLKEKQDKNRIKIENRIIGENLEVIIRKIIGNEGLEVTSKYKGGDLEIWPEEMEGWDSGLIEISPHLIEIKFTSGGRVHLSRAQSEMASERKDNYYVLVVENAEDLRKQLKVIEEHLISQDLIDLIVDNSFVVEDIHEKLGSFPNPEEVEPDINGYWIKKKLWKDKTNVLEWLESKFSHGV